MSVERFPPNRSVRPALRAVTESVNVNVQDKNLVVDASGNPVVLTLPTAARAVNMELTAIKVDDSANRVTLAAATNETINGAATKVLASQYDAVTVVSDGTAWLII